MGRIFLKTEHHHYDLGEVVSALQKEIRRGNEMEAMFWADECCPKFAKAMWKRLIVISHEDIGLADIRVQQYTDICQRQWFEMCKDGKQGSARMVLANVILLLCRSPKSRLADHFQTHLRGLREIEGVKMEVPDYALDKHTARGKAMGRSWDHFRIEGTQLDDPAPIQDPYEESFWRYKPLLPKIGTTKLIREELLEDTER